jgi:glutathione S-transferase
MSQVTLIGPPQSSYVRTARMCCIEKGVSHTLEPVDQRADEHRKLHPWIRVPIFRHGDLQLIETSAICRYVDAAFDGPRLIPADPRQAAVMEQWVSAINCYIYDHTIRHYALQYIVPGLRGEAPNRAVIDETVPLMQRDLGLLDGAYAKSRWIAGDAISLADLFVAPIVATARMFPEAESALVKCRHLTRAADDLATRDSFSQVHAPA